MSNLMSLRRTFVFLQGPHGPFFHLLGKALAARGHVVLRINLNGGDRHDWPAPATNYSGNAEAWPEFFGRFVATHGVTDVLLFGDCRPLHRAAHIVAKARGVRICVFEEGYLRPDFMTLEFDGVNGHSTLPSNPAWYVETARDLPPFLQRPPVPSSFRRRVKETMAYQLHTQLQGWRFLGYHTHRPEHPALEFIGWLGQMLVRRRAQAEAQAGMASLTPKQYFVFPLQLNSDHQIRTHSHFPSMSAAIYTTLESFSRMAPPDTLLLVKQHPLDNGVINWRKVVKAQAAALGISDRVLFIRAGDIATIVADARGVVTVNSTTGTLSISAGVPTMVLGKAIYNVPGVTHHDTLDSFWRDPTPPDAALWDAFCRVLYDRCLIHGGLLSEEGLDLLVEGAAARLVGPELVAAPAHSA
jgi:capsular polysaccharide export protein